VTYVSLILSCSRSFVIVVMLLSLKQINMCMALLCKQHVYF
jgi:hypothetical protein